MHVKPLHDWLVVRVEKHKPFSTSIIQPPDSYEENVRKGTVLAFGPGKELPNGVRDPIGVQVGDKVCFLRWHGEHQPGKAQATALANLYESEKGEVVMIRKDDILFAYEVEFTVEVTSI